jgi:leucyl-tRNA synthetase
MVKSMEKYDPKKIEAKWQKILEEKESFKASDRSKKPKSYLLVEFPYPSGAGLHVGHCRSYTALDVVARKKRQQGENVLFPMGWDAFGLPTENYAIKTGIHPAVVTKQNTENFKNQLKRLGLSFDWSREINTTDPAYYKWTQWIFTQLFKRGLAYKAKMSVNWCPSCKIVLANEEVINAKCERCGAEVEAKEKEQWMLKITEYAERLLNDLDLVDYPERVKVSQKEWIGRSEGAEIIFKAHDSLLNIPIFTTRPDTLFGCSYVVLTPEHPLIEKLKDRISNISQVEKYIEKSKKKMNKERSAEDKEKTGVELIGIKATNPSNNRKIPIFVADYVLMQYGTGAVMAVPTHDQRDFEFAKKYNLPMIEVIQSAEGSFEKAYEGEGTLINSGRFSGMDSKTGRRRIIEWLELKKIGSKKISYKFRDWIFSRQRYWGEPIPMVFCEKCGWVPVPEINLPVELPEVKNYLPTEEGDSPLAKVKDWVETKCPTCKGKARRETDVMPNWAGSNWYYLAYVMRGISNFQFPISKYRKVLKYWMPVDWYNGGMEHNTLHLLYSRFIYKFLWDIGAVPKELGSEPYKKRTSHGMILGEGGVKMSKSKGNVINPDEVVKEYGADVLRTYEMFMGPFEQAIPWDTKGLMGVKRFLEKVWNLQYKNLESRTQNPELESLIHKTTKKVSEDIEALKFNTAVSQLMILANYLDKEKELSIIYYSLFLILLSPFAPHLAEELWSRAGFKGMILEQAWPKFNPKLVKEKKISLLIQINGRVRDKIQMEAGILQKEAEVVAKKSEKAKKYLEGKKIRKTIFVSDKLINFVI